MSISQEGNLVEESLSSVGRPTHSPSRSTGVLLMAMAAALLSAAGLNGAPLQAQNLEQRARQASQAKDWPAVEKMFLEIEAERPLSAAEIRAAVEASEQLNHWKRVVSLYSELDRLKEMSVGERVKLYEAHLRSGDKKAAETQLLRARQGSPGDENLVHLLAFLYLDAGLDERAIQVYDDYLARHPSAYESRVNVALIHFGVQQASRAFQHLDRAFRTAEGPASRYFYRQLVRNMGGMSPEELAVLARDVKTELGFRVEEPAGLRVMAEEYSNLNRYQQAIYCFGRYLNLRPDDRSVRFELARLHHLAGEDSESRAVLEPLLEGSDSESDRARLFAAELAVKGGAYERAAQLLDSLPGAMRTQGTFQFLAGRVALERGEIEEARRLLEKVTKESPELTEAFLHLGQIYMRTGRVEEGRRLLAEFQRRKRGQ